MKYDAAEGEPPISLSDNGFYYFQKPNYDVIWVVESNLSNSVFLDIASNEYRQTQSLIFEPNGAESYKDSCSVSHKDKLYFYGGSNYPNKVFKFECNESKTLTHSIKFNFVGGTCTSQNNNILLCFPIENNRLCYKSKNPLPEKWWQWFTYVELSYATHDSIALSSGKAPDTISRKVTG